MIRPSGMVVAVMHVRRLKSPNIPGPLKKSAPVNAQEMCIVYVIESREVWGRGYEIWGLGIVSHPGPR